MGIMLNNKRFHPGVYIKDALDTLKITSKEFACITGIEEKILSDILKGESDITFEIAGKLAAYFTNTSNFWLNLQNEYNSSKP